MATGYIAKIIADRGFGFVSPDEPGGRDIFFHLRALPPQTHFNDRLHAKRVEFEVADTPRGRVAVVVKLVE